MVVGIDAIRLLFPQRSLLRLWFWRKSLIGVLYLYLTLFHEPAFPSFTARLSGFLFPVPQTGENISCLLKPEFVPTLRHVYGAVGAGRDDNPEKLSAGCQFYIVQNKKGLPRLDDNYTVFGQVFKGMDVIDAITAVKTDTNNASLAP